MSTNGKAIRQVGVGTSQEATNELVGVNTDRAAEHPMAVKGFDRLLTTQRPVVLAHIRSIRKRHPEAGPARIIHILERRYLAAVTTGGAGVGVAAVVPGVGTGVSLVLTGVETAGFLETTALFAQSVTEIHGIAVTDPDRARTTVMAMMLGTSGADLVRNLAAQATGKGVAQTKFWGDIIGKNVPQALVGSIADRMQKAFLKRFTRNTATGAVGRILPFGVGALVGGTANNMLGRKVVASSRSAFGPAPDVFPVGLEPKVVAPGQRAGERVVRAARASRDAVAGALPTMLRPRSSRREHGTGAGTRAGTRAVTTSNAGPDAGTGTDTGTGRRTGTDRSSPAESAPGKTVDGR